METKTCNMCGVDYPNTTKYFQGWNENGKQRLKSTCKTCRNLARKRNGGIIKNCAYCAKEFKSIEISNLYCSKECWAKKRNEKYKYTDLIRVLNKLIKQKQNQRKCIICGESFYSTQSKIVTCSSCRYKKQLEKARMKYNPVYNPRENKCIICGNIFETNKPTINYCSESCKKTKDREQKKNENTKRRLRETNQFIEKVYRSHVYVRDKWICQICGKKVNKNHMYPHPMSASIDHIIPLAQGGTHEYKNVQLAHWICNSLKRDGAANDQLRIY